MGKIRCGDMYMVSFEHPSKLYAWSVYRVWWMPWRYNLRFYYMSNVRVDGLCDVNDEVVAKRLTKDGLKGTLKIFELLKED
jgi:alpha-tubulin suppressor-like RCC1 family protein